MSKNSLSFLRWRSTVRLWSNLQDVFEEGIMDWRHSLVGQFVGAIPNFSSLQKIVELMWGNVAPIKGLSYIASAIGKPILMDSITASRERLEYARVCIEISAGSKIPDHIDVMLCNGSIVSLRVKVPWLPVSCDECARFGHSGKFCRLGKKVVQIWKAKGKIQGPNVPNLGKDVNGPVRVDITSKDLHENSLPPQGTKLEGGHAKIGGDAVTAATRGDISNFQFFVDELGLSDHPFSGPLFTWSNKQQGSFLALKLDRVLVNLVWFGTFADSEVEFLAPGDSDHCPAFVWFFKSAPVTRPKPFKFLTSGPSTLGLAVVEESWQLTNLVSGATGQDVSLELETEKELKALENAKLLFYKQKTKLGMADSSVTGSSVSIIRDLLGYSLLLGAADSLCSEVSDMEIKYAIWGQGNDKSPGPDGYNSFSSRLHGQLLVKTLRMLSADLSARGAQVSWKHACLMKSKGGLGVVNLEGWNKACTGLLIRKLLANDGSLWLAWVFAYVIKNLDFWQMYVPVNARWCFKKILEMRPAVSQLFAGSVDDLNTRKIWEELRTQSPKVIWHMLVWFPGRIPKQSIILWMAILDRLLTRARLSRMGVNLENVNCLFYGSITETRSHLFLSFYFVKDLWGKILSLCGIVHDVSTWDGKLAWAVQLLRGKSLIVQVTKLAFASHVYCIWRERNARLFGGRGRSVGELLNDIQEIIHICFQIWSNSRADSKNVSLCTSWGSLAFLGNEMELYKKKCNQYSTLLIPDAKKEGRMEICRVRESVTVKEGLAPLNRPFVEIGSEIGKLLLTSSGPFVVKLNLHCLESNILVVKLKLALRLGIEIGSEIEKLLLTSSGPFVVKLNLRCLECHDILRRGVEIADGPFVMKLSLDLNILRREVEIQVLYVAGGHNFLRHEVETVETPLL
ncbi:hypothetical protein F3Y22_tig00111837pilonHSYRG00775 [Hibiscus syriacus]|uniref:Reverse transcriptase zinc-binding domain-containing protein n=1 Tax=Hibiscus syriacus TaxID=106335 RepID=A0A6A2YC50_HIBSY|nr:hypothetical protein F3Y22_tig00111837pilonHSYRG00775 [Hibiscus syriacus]